ncbi:MAG: TRAP transporter substrate-binding protein [Clostridia bacterium]|nr:TRAP transporter substrate-binding protein [Clostridia bacterium]
MKKLVTLALTLVFVLTCASMASAGSEMTLKLATDAALDYPTTQAIARFGELVEEKTDGRISIEIYPSSLLGDEVSYMEQLQIGTVDIAKLSIGTLNGLYTDLQVFNLPFMFKNSDELWKVLESDIGDRVLNGLNDYNIQGIGFTDNGNRNFFTTKPIETIDDFSGMTIRVQQNNMMIRMVECLGANAVNVSANEVYSALQTGVCAGGENNVNVILTESYYEVAPYVTLDSHTTGMDVICVNLDLWNSLSEEDQTIMMEAMAEATVYDREIWNAAVDESKAELEAKGAIISVPSDEVLDSFKAAMQPLYDEYADKLGDWIDAINAVLAEE